MKPIKQTKIGEGGNCFDACLASILEKPIEIFPNHKGKRWEGEYQEWLQNKFGLTLLFTEMSDYILDSIPPVSYNKF